MVSSQDRVALRQDKLLQQSVRCVNSWVKPRVQKFPSHRGQSHSSEAKAMADNLKTKAGNFGLKVKAKD